MLIIKPLHTLAPRMSHTSILYLSVLMFNLLPTLSACSLIGSKIHLTAAVNTTLQGSDISPSAELGLYSIYGRYGYLGAKIFDFAEQLLVGYQHNLFNPAPTIITSYSNNAGFLGFGLSHEVETAHTERQYFGGKLMFFGPTYTTNLSHTSFEVFGYVGSRWSLYDDGSERLFGLGMRLHYRLNPMTERHKTSWKPPPPPPPLTPEQQHHMRMWRIKEIRQIIDKNPDYRANESLINELERLEREEEAYQKSLKTGP